MLQLALPRTGEQPPPFANGSMNRQHCRQAACKQPLTMPLHPCPLAGSQVGFISLAATGVESLPTGKDGLDDNLTVPAVAALLGSMLL